MSTVSARRTLGRRETSQIIVCRPRHRSFSPLFFLTTMLVNGWSRGAGIYPAASDRSITGGWNAPLLFLVVSAVVAQCAAIAFHFVTCPPRNRTVSRHTSRRRSHSPLAERKDGCPSRVNRERSSTRSCAAGGAPISNPAGDAR